VLDGAEDAGAKEAVALRLEGPVVDRLRLLDLAERPGCDIARTGNRDANLIEGRRYRLLLEQVGDFVHRLSLIWRAALAVPRPPACYLYPSFGRRWGKPGALDRRSRHLLAPCRRLRIDEFNVQAQRPHFLDQHVEALGNAGLERIVSAH